MYDDDPMTSWLLAERRMISLLDNCCVIICLFIWDEKATSPVFLHDINHKYKWQDWIECLNTDASTNKSIIVTIKCFPVIILLSRNVSSTQRSSHWRDTILWWQHKKPNSQFLWLSDQWPFLWINDDLDLIRLHLLQERPTLSIIVQPIAPARAKTIREKLCYIP